MSHKICSEINDISSKTLIKFKYIYFETDKPLICKKCNSKLLVKKKSSKEKGDFLEIQECSNKDCFSHNKLKRSEYWRYFFPKEVYDKKINKIRINISENHITNINMWLKKGFSEEDAKKKISEIQSINSKKNIENRFKPTKENYIKMGYGEEEIYNICLTPSQIEFWIKKRYTEKDALKMVSKNQSYAAQFVDFEKRLLPSNIEYWLKKGFSITESILQVKKHQTTFSKEICIEKYGEKKGLKILNDRNRKWLKSLHSNGNMSSGYSKISQDLFNTFGYNKNYYYATKNYEISLTTETSLLYLYDFTDIKNKLIIEYNGDIFHANPKFFQENDKYNPFNDELSKTKWKKDDIKINVAKELGYDVLIIWDSEYRENKEIVINKCKKFLNIK